MAGNVKIQNANGKTVTLQNPDTNNSDITVEMDKVVVKDSAGNVGLGVTPSGWGAGKAIEVGTAGNGIWSNGAGNNRYMANAYWDGTSYRYATTGVASTMMAQSNGATTWYTTPAGTAGNAMTWSTTMSLDANGNLGVGTSPMRKFHIHDASLPIIQLTNSTTGNTDVNRGGFIYESGTGMYFTNKENGSMHFGNNGLSQVQVSSTGDFLLTSGTGGLGYGTGAGGTVTQATSKSTAVTLNKPSGQITTSNSALAANTTTAFTFTNSLLTTSDDIIVSCNNGNYNIWATVGSGGCGVWIKNNTAGSLSDAIVINFTVIKGAIA